MAVHTRKRYEVNESKRTQSAFNVKKEREGSNIHVSLEDGKGRRGRRQQGRGGGFAGCTFYFVAIATFILFSFSRFVFYFFFFLFLNLKLLVSSAHSCLLITHQSVPCFFFFFF